MPYKCNVCPTISEFSDIKCNSPVCGFRTGRFAQIAETRKINTLGCGIPLIILLTATSIWLVSLLFIA